MCSSDLTEVCLKKKHDLRVQRYNEQWAELSKKPETEEVLRSMNHAEQRDEAEREEKQELTAAGYFVRGMRAYNEKRFQDAITAHTAAIEKNPTCSEYYSGRGLSYYMLDQYKKAIADYTMAIKLCPQKTFAYLYRGAASIQAV